MREIIFFTPRKMRKVLNNEEESENKVGNIVISIRSKRLHGPETENFLTKPETDYITKYFPALEYLGKHEKSPEKLNQRKVLKAKEKIKNSVLARSITPY